MVELKENNIVVLRNGKIGAVASFNHIPRWIIFKAFMGILSKYNDDLKYQGKNKATSSVNEDSDYDIVKILDGSSITEVNDLFKDKIDISKLPIIFER